jgi:hypothetical protein
MVITGRATGFTSVMAKSDRSAGCLGLRRLTPEHAVPTFPSARGGMSPVWRAI